jgi:cobyric acid synthase CobQ/L-threonine-O-3-phosphate decarboxylase
MPLLSAKPAAAGDQEDFRHGGNVRELADKAGCAPEDLLDFSASINPLGPPDWVRETMAAGLGDIGRYPDPESSELALSACEHYQVWPTEAVAGNGTGELMDALLRSSRLGRAVIPAPAYVDYARSCKACGLKAEHLDLDPASGFAMDWDRLDSRLQEPAVVFMAQPNNPTGGTFEAETLRELANRRQDSLFIVDEAFADFVPGLDRMIRDRPDNVAALYSLTKFFSLPGLRAALVFARPERIQAVKAKLPPWTVNVFAQRIGARCFRDAAFMEDSRASVAELRRALAEELATVPGLRVLPSEANFILCQVSRVGMSARPLAERLLSEGIAIRLCDNFRGLDETWFRVAVRGAEENERLIQALKATSGVKAEPKPKKKPAVMLQGTSSDAGKSVLAAALCRILHQDGLSPAPFKAQNMSLNSCVTPDGLEMGRAQATQAMACKLELDARMNPVLLKPNSDTGSQVIVMGKPVGNMAVQEYVQFKPKALAAARQAYDELAAEHDVMVLEGAGSPAEINLRAHDIANMTMAGHAGARVLLAGDIDRGGVFASLAGTMELMTETERRLVSGFILNKFRGDASLLDPAIHRISERTGKPFLGVVPHLDDLGLPDEDSVAFKAQSRSAAAADGQVDVAVVDLPRISNFTDVDPFKHEPDVNLRVVRTADELGRPDAVIIPGSKSTVADLGHLRETGLAEAVAALHGTSLLVGVCGGLQMLGQYVADPERVESEAGTVEGLGVLPLSTTLAPEKTLTRVEGSHTASGLEVRGYEIHHGESQPLLPAVRPVMRSRLSAPLGWGLKDGSAWGTYLHGVFDADEFRRYFIDVLRKRRGLAPLKAPQTVFNLDPALDRLADAVRDALDMEAVYRLLGL